MNDRPIYYVHMNDVSVCTGVHILSRTDAGKGLYELCFMFLHFLFAHTLLVSLSSGRQEKVLKKIVEMINGLEVTPLEG